MNFRTQHPEPETLQAYGLGQLDDTSAEVVNKHLEGCQDCRRHVAETAPDSFLGRLRNAQNGSETAASSGAIPGVLQFGATAAEAGADFRPAPCMSSTGQRSASSAALNTTDDSGCKPGARIGFFGDYELLRVLGEGGMGIVYQARQISLNRPVALKMIKASRFPSANEVRRFQNESEAVARLDHPNIVPVFEVGQHEDQHYFSMKLIGGESLDKCPERYLSDPRGAAELVATTAGAIHHAHRRGILHRDLKPANILIDPDGRPHVTDFGLAKRVEGDCELTRSGAILGTPAYMAPEQTSGTRGVVTTAADVYGLGAVLYVLLTGREPFDGESVIDTLEQVRERSPEPPRKRNPRVPRDLEVICLKCLEKVPHRRYANAETLAEDLKHWLAGEPITARPVGNAARLWMWCRRRPLIAGLAAALLLAVLGGLVGVSLALRKALKAEDTALLARHDAERESERARAQTELAQQRLYDVQMNLIQRYWEDYHGEQLQQALDEQRPLNPGAIDRRGFEWYYWRRKMSSGHITLHGHAAGVRSVAYSPGAKLLASASDDGTVKTWDLRTGHEIRSLKGHSGRVWSVAFSPDGKRLASASLDETVKVWDALTGEEIRTLKGHEDLVNSVSYSPDEKWLVSASHDRSVKVWNAHTGHETLTVDGGASGVCGVAFGPDSTRLAVVSGGRTVTVWNALTGQQTMTLKGHSDEVVSVAFSPDVTRLASATADGNVKVWDAATGQETLTLKGHAGHVTSIAFARDSKRIATGGWDGMVKVWDARPLANQPASFEAANSRMPNDTGQTEWPQSDEVGSNAGDSLDEIRESARLQPENHSIRHKFILALLDCGDRAGMSGECSELMEWFCKTTDPSVANSVAWSCVLAPSAVADPEAPVQLADRALKNIDDADERSRALNTLGAALYRADRLPTNLALLR